jgi:hypothetical protein
VSERTDFYGTRLCIECEIDGDADFARERAAEILEWLIEREDVLSCGAQIGPEGILIGAGEDDCPSLERGDWEGL